MSNDTAYSPTVNDFLNIGITGSRKLPDYRVVRNVLWEIRRDYERQYQLRLVVGCCIGVDEYAMRWGDHFSIPVHGVVPPDRRLVVPDWQELCTTWEEIEPGDDGFKRRNQRLVDLTDVLVSFPLHAEANRESRRSGTWQTIRMGRRKGIICETDVYVLSGGV